MLPTDQFVNHLYKTEGRRVLATLIRLLKDFDLAEEAMQEAFSIALQRWPQEGIPQNPRAWLVSTGRFKAIDQLRRRATFNNLLIDVAEELESSISDSEDWGERTLEDDQLRLIFTCCHPSIAPEAQMALTLREVCGLTTEAIAKAFLINPTTLAQRIVRAKNKIRDAKIPYEIPTENELESRLDSVLHVIYLLFNEGYSASQGEQLIRHDLAQEAIRLCRLLAELLPDPEVLGLLALMLIQDSRRDARTNENGDLIRLEDQDRNLWHQHQIREGSQLIQQATNAGPAGSYCIQAAIAALHAQAPSFAETNWPEIVAFYDVLMRIHPSPIIALNRAVALAHRDGAAAGLLALQELEKELKDYYLFHAASADFLVKTNNLPLAKEAYEKAIELTEQLPEKRFLKDQLAKLDDANSTIGSSEEYVD
jgi:RNA polymerase sigma-70 factor (ECF subfamily)